MIDLLVSYWLLLIQVFLFNDFGIFNLYLCLLISPSFTFRLNDRI